PLPVDGRIYQRFKPKRSRKARGVFRHAPQVGVLDNRNGDVRQGYQAVIHRFQKKAMQIDEVPGNANRCDLTTAVRQGRDSADKSREQQRTERGSTALFHQGFAGCCATAPT
ncbi:MAG: hypothetical protein ACJAVC_001310, partial [Brevundimonas sp.]